jgi:hypothetical protein
MWYIVELLKEVTLRMRTSLKLLVEILNSVLMVMSLSSLFDKANFHLESKNILH